MPIPFVNQRDIHTNGPRILREKRHWDSEGRERTERIIGSEQCPKCGLWWPVVEQPEEWYESDTVPGRRDATGWWGASCCEQCQILMVEQPDLFDVKYLVQQACNYKVIGHRDNQYIWYSKAGSQDVYNLGTSFDKMVSFFYNEYVTHNTESDITNWYADLHEELRMKNIWIE
jgi:hypothetical protein